MIQKGRICFKGMTCFLWTYILHTNSWKHKHIYLMESSVIGKKTRRSFCNCEKELEYQQCAKQTDNILNLNKQKQRKWHWHCATNFHWKCSSFLLSVDVTEFHTVAAYCSLCLTRLKYKINKQWRVEKSKLQWVF